MADGTMLPEVPQDLRHDYRGKCWWCGQPADSREHRYKKTDVIKAFGPAPWAVKPVRFASGAGQGQEIQGPKSDRLKFAAVLCSACNNARSQEFDHAYRIFSDFADDNAEAFAARSVIDFRKIYGVDYRRHQKFLTKYFVKHVCCRLAEDRIKVPEAVIEYLDGTQKRLTHLSLTLGVNAKIYEMEQHLEKAHAIPPGSLWLGDHTCTYSQSRRVLLTAHSHVGYKWLWLDYMWNFERKSATTNLQFRRTRLPVFHNPELTEPMESYCQECNPIEE